MAELDAKKDDLSGLSGGLHSIVELPAGTPLPKGLPLRSLSTPLYDTEVMPVPKSELSFFKTDHAHENVYEEKLVDARTLFCRWDDIGYVARIILSKEKHYVSFKVCRINGWHTDDGRPDFDTPEDQPTDNFEKAETFLEGTVKWDGCSNFEFSAQKNAMLHCCSKDDVVAIGTLLGRIYDCAARLIPEHKENFE